MEIAMSNRVKLVKNFGGDLDHYISSLPPPEPSKSKVGFQLPVFTFETFSWHPEPLSPKLNTGTILEDWLDHPL
eukprot:5501035-Amphidinium_carterae.1